MMINLTFKPGNRKQNIAFGIQNWLMKKGYCKAKNETQLSLFEYKELLDEFCKTQEDFDPSKVKNLESIEKFIDKRFQKFCTFCGHKNKKK